MKRRTIHGDRSYPGPAGQCAGKFQHVRRCGGGAAAERGGERIGAQIDGHPRSRGLVGTGNQSQQGVRGGAELRARVQQDRGQFQVDTV